MSVKFLFHSDVEAMAFIAGLNYVDDPSIKINNVCYDKMSNSWYVSIFDSYNYKEVIYDLTNSENFLFSFGETKNDDVDFSMENK